jgi:phenylacetate-CoA ligase
VALKSGGSTGRPVTVFRDPGSFPAEAAQRERHRSLVTRLAGRRFRHRQATIAPLDSSAVEAADEVRRQSLLPTDLRVERRVYSMWRDPTDLIEELNRYRPNVLHGYGSYFEVLFGLLREGQARMSLPQVVVYGADALSDGIRAYILEELGIELLNTYNAIETPGVGWECEAHRGYHLNVDVCPVRLVRPDGGPVPPGEDGEVVISNLVNRGSVLLNYRLADLAGPVAGPCPCGRNLPMLSFLEARASAWLHLGGGRSIHPHAARLPFRRERDLWRYQVVQEERRRFLVRAVLRPGADRGRMTERLGGLLRDSLPEGDGR